MTKIAHYMVDYADANGDVQFANAAPIQSLSAAKALASKTSKTYDTGAYVVAYTNKGTTYGRVRPCGHISFFDGTQSETDGIVI
jgi:hypothetical protein